jgi:hypothetical protein
MSFVLSLGAGEGSDGIGYFLAHGLGLLGSLGLGVPTNCRRLHRHLRWRQIAARVHNPELPARTDAGEEAEQLVEIDHLAAAIAQPREPAKDQRGRELAGTTPGALARHRGQRSRRAGISNGSRRS